jgi:hypothetical protein
VAGQKITVPLPSGTTATGTEVAVTESTERWSEFTLADGSVLRAKLTMASAVRIDGQFDPEGNPLYAAKGQPITAVVSVPQELKQKKQ